jgi:hypothetical protein
LRNGHHGIALYTGEGQLVWGTGTDNVALEAGHHFVNYTFESLPLRPGPYSWHVTIFEDQVLLDSSYCVPQLLISTVPTGHRRDECAGFLNIDYSVVLHSTGGREHHAPEQAAAPVGTSG